MSSLDEIVARFEADVMTAWTAYNEAVKNLDSEAEDFYEQATPARLIYEGAVNDAKERRDEALASMGDSL